MSEKPVDPTVVVVLPGGGGEPLAKALEAQLKAGAPPAPPVTHELWGEGEGQVTVGGAGVMVGGSVFVGAGVTVGK